MNILWIPHNPWGPGRYQRDQYLMDRLRVRHRIHVVTWSSFLPHTLGNLANPRTYFRALRFHQQSLNGTSVYHVPRVPAVLRRLSSSRPNQDAVNDFLMRLTVEKILQREGIDVVVSAQPLDGARVAAPVVFDYVDWGGPLAKPDQRCLQNAAAALCVSKLLLAEAQRYNAHSVLVPNGADVSWIRQGDGLRVRQKHGLADSPVVSLIGLTTSPRLYFIPAILKVKTEVPGLKCLLVGHSEEIAQRVAALDPRKETFRYVGPVPYREVRDYFAASDVGLYPSEDSTYYQAASPIKIFEYTAANKFVVLSRLTEVQAFGWPNLVCVPPEIDDFAQGMATALRLREGPFPATPGLERHDWSNLAASVETILERVVQCL